MLSIGDQVQGKITRIDLEKQQLQISLTDRLRELSVGYNERKIIQLDLFIDRISLSEDDNETKPRQLNNTFNNGKSSTHRYRPPVLKLEKVLVIDDNNSDLEKICPRLEEDLEVEVDGVQSGQEALDRLETLDREQDVESYDLAVIDCRLKHESGAEVAKNLIVQKPDLAVLFMSSDPLAAKELPDFNGLKFPFADKSPENIVEWVSKLCKDGYEKEIREPDIVAYTGSGGFIKQLGMSDLARRSLPDMLLSLLASLRQETGISQGVVLEVDTTNSEVQVLVADPPRV